jgi:heat-inducible transcriptional repressor
MALLPEAIDESEMALLRARLSALITGQGIGEASDRLQALLAADEMPKDLVLRAIAGVVMDELGSFRQERLVMAGAATLARREHDFRGSIHPLLEAIEEQVTLLRLMSEMVTDEHGLAASIGTENAPFGLGEASIVASNYAAPSGTARVGVMGPTRMDYPSNLAAARAVARYLSRMLDEDEAGR